MSGGRLVALTALASGLVVSAAGCKESTGPKGPDLNCTPSTTPLSLNIGDVHPLSPAEICQVQLQAGAGAEYVLIPFFSSATSTAHLQLDVTGQNVGAVTGPPRPSIASAQDARFPGVGLAGSTLQRDVRFDLSLRARERELFAAHAAQVRAWYAAQRAQGGPSAAAPPGINFTRSAVAGPNRSLNTIGSQVGDVLTVNAQAVFSCSNPLNIGARVAAITAHAIVLADTLNPAGGFTDAEYQSIGFQFDTVVNPLDTQAFGAPADIDGNGKVILLYTKAVNELTPANSNSFVGGFFFGRDLLDTGSCPTSNVAEMFYLLVPDPTGTINGNTHTKGFVDTVTVSTIAHEYQHLINASRRLFVNTGADPDEEVWLNEGLSHTAEELLFFRESGLTPRQNIDVNTLRGSSQIIAAFNRDDGQNFGRLLSYLDSPASTAPYRSDDDEALATRGATWEFLRYSADRKSPTDGTIWFDLVNSLTSGAANFQNVFGADIKTWVEDFTVAQYLDDAGVGAPGARYSFPTWNFRDVFPALGNCCTRLPLRETFLTSGIASTLDLIGGGAAYVRFSEGSNATVSIESQGQPVPTALHATLVRTK